MEVVNKVRKGDVVALAVTHSSTYTFGSGRGTECRTAFTLAIVASATRAGEVKTLRKCGGLLERSPRLQDIQTISKHPFQAKAKALFLTLKWPNDEFESVELLRAAIHATPAN